MIAIPILLFVTIFLGWDYYLTIAGIERGHYLYYVGAGIAFFILSLSGFVQVYREETPVGLFDLLIMRGKFAKNTGNFEAACSIIAGLYFIYLGLREVF